MLACILRPVVRLALWVFFSDIDVRGLNRVPTGVPLIYVANHPNVMMDPLIISLNVPGAVPHFLGKGALFKYPVLAWFLRRLGLIAVARARDEGSQLSANRDMLRAAHQVLRRGQALAAFPEGFSHAQMRVHDVEPGVARIALRAAAEAEAGAGIHIVPIGLTYSDPGLFRSEVDVHFGEAIAVGPFVKSTREDRRASEQELTGLIHDRLSALTRHVEDADLETTIADLSAIYAEDVMAQLPESAELSRRLRAQQEIIRGVQHFTATEPELVHAVARRLRAHRRKLNRVGLDRDVAPAPTDPFRPLRVALALLLAPLALYGFIHNALPYYLPRLFARPYRRVPEMIATVKFSTGVGLLLVWYCALVGAAAVLMTPPTAVLLYALSLPLSGLLTLAYDERILRRLSSSTGAPWSARRRRRHLERLADERAEIIRELDELKERYLAAEA